MAVLVTFACDVCVCMQTWHRYHLPRNSHLGDPACNEVRAQDRSSLPARSCRGRCLAAPEDRAIILPTIGKDMDMKLCTQPSGRLWEYRSGTLRTTFFSPGNLRGSALCFPISSSLAFAFRSLGPLFHGTSQLEAQFGQTALRRAST